MAGDINLFLNNADDPTIAEIMVRTMARLSVVRSLDAAIPQRILICKWSVYRFHSCIWNVAYVAARESLWICS